MDRTEKLEYEKGIEQYFDDNKVYDLFEKLFKELIINKPENPVDYLIERLGRKDLKRIFITGHSGTNRKNISLALANSLDYSCLNMEHLLEREISKKMENAAKIEKNYNENRLVDDEIVIELVRNQLIKYEEENRSYIIEGFPRNRTQAIFLQEIGLLPDNVIVLTTTREKAKEQIFNKLRERLPKPHEKNEEGEPDPSVDSENNNNVKTDEQIWDLAKISVEESDMNIRAVEDVFSGFYCEIQVDKFDQDTEVVDELAKILKFKTKTNAARRPPRIILVAPPCFGKSDIAKKIASQLKITPVDINDLLKKEISLNNENSKIILKSLESDSLVDDKFILKLLEDRLYCSDCRINGWVLTGFPKSHLQINFMENLNPEIKPSLIAVIDSEKENIQEKGKKIKYDPKTGKYYKEVNGEFFGSNNVKATDDIVKRLVNRKQDNQEILDKRIESWKEVNDILLQKDYKNLLKLDGEYNEDKLAQLIVDAVGYNS